MAKDRETPQPVSSYPQTPLLYDLNDMLSWTRFLSERRITGILSKSPIVPVTVIGSIDSGETFHPGSVGFSARTIPDQDTASPEYHLLMSHARSLSVLSQDPYDWTPTGRYVLLDRMGGTMSWTQASGTVAYNTIRPYPGMSNNLGLTAAAGVGQTAQGTFRVFRLADAAGRGNGGTGGGNGPKVQFGCLFRFNDANANYFQMGIQLLDAQSQMIARFGVAEATGAPMALNSAGSWINLSDASWATNWTSGGGAYAISTNPTWHRLEGELHYQSGGATLQYVRIRVDDFPYDATPYQNGQNFGAATVNESLLELTVVNASAGSAASVDVAEVVVKDLSNTRAIIG